MTEKNSISRRRFIEQSGLALGAACCSLHSSAEAQDDDPLTAFIPCIDYPIRVSASDPPDPTPIEYALEIAEDGKGAAEGAPKSPARAMRALRDAVARAPRSNPGEAARAPARLAAMNRWLDKDVLNVRFLSGTSDLHDHVLELVREWTPLCGLEFRGSKSSNAEITCGFITNRLNPKGGHWSYVGTDANNVRGQTMNLAITAPSLEKTRYHRAVVRHEFGHALGCIHEHQNPGDNGIRFDPTKTIAYFKRTYGWSERMTRDNVLTRYSARQLQRFSDFDSDSIMLYKYPAEITVDGRGTKQNFELSHTDKKFMALLYEQDLPDDAPEKPTPPEKSVERELMVGAAPLNAEITASDPANRFRFKITEAGTYTIRTRGYTQLVFSKLIDANSNAVSLEGRLFTPDLVNQVATPELPTGEYKLEVAHEYGGGVGEYSVELQKGDQR